MINRHQLQPIKKHILLLLLFFIFTNLTNAWGHVPGQCAIFLQSDHDYVSGRLNLYYTDLLMFTRDVPDNVYSLSPQAILEHEQTIVKSIKNKFHFLINAESREMLDVRLQVDENQLPYSLTLHFRLAKTTGPPESIKIETPELFKSNPQYVVLVSLDINSKNKTVILSEDHRSAELFINPFQEFIVFLKYGLQHICLGFDHVFFLLLLIFHPFLVTHGQAESLRFKKISWKLIKLATAFTIAHSLTLFLAVMSFSIFPEKLVELVIIGSIIFMGLHNLFQFEIAREWLIVFSFGLFHGYGFSSALRNLGLGRENLAIPLAGFNIGVEAGQLLIILTILFPLYKLTSTRNESIRLLQFICALITIIAAFWFLENFLQVLGVM